MGTAVVVYLDRDRLPWRRAYFKSEAIRVTNELGALGPFPVHTGEELVELGKGFRRGSVSHLVGCGHGGSDWFLNSKTGVSTVPTARYRKHGQRDISEFISAWAPAFTASVLITYAACLCSRSPIRWMKRVLGRVMSGWGRRGYVRGGQACFSSRTRDYLFWYRIAADVRGHRTSGDLFANSIAAKHVGDVGELCHPLSMLALPNEPVTFTLRRWWTKHVTGKLAERWLLGDDSVEMEIAELWAKR